MEILVGKTAPVHDGTGQKNRRRQRKKPTRQGSPRRAASSGRFSPSVIVHLSGRKRKKAESGAA